MTDPIERERALYRYHTALQRGDFAAVAAILRRAESDPELARMVLELNAALEAEEASPARPVAVQPILHSTNGQRPPGAPTQEEHPMTLMTATSPARPVRRFKFAPSLTLIAALIAVALFGGLLLLNQSGGMFASGGANLPPDGGNPLSAGARQVVTATPLATAILPPSATPTASPTAIPTGWPVTPTPVPMPIPDDLSPLPPTVVPWGPSLFSMAPSLPLGETLTNYLPGEGDMGIFLFSAPQDGAYSLAVTALDFEPRLLVYTLDDPDLGTLCNAEESPLPTVALELSAGDRMLVLVYSADRAASGEYLISVRAE